MSRALLSRRVRILLMIALVQLACVDARASTWTITSIDMNGNGTLGFYSSLALDSQNRPCVSYSQQLGGAVRYAVLNSGAWMIEQVAFAQRPSLALTPFDAPRIAYRVDNFPPETRFARKVGGTWSFELIDNTGAETWGPSLALMSNDNVGVAFRGGGGGFLNFAFRAATPPWTIEVPTSFENNMNNSLSLKLDPQGNPRIAFTDGSNLEYAERSAGVWTSTIVLNTGTDCSLALDGLGNPHISLYDEIAGNLRYAHRAGGVWTIESVDTAGVTGMATAITLNGFGVPHIVYSRGGQLRFAHRAGGTWTIEIVNPSVQGYPSIDIDFLGVTHLSFLWSGVLRYAFRDSPTDVPASPVSSVSLRVAPNPIGAAGALVSFALPSDAGSSGIVVNFYDASGRSVRHAFDGSFSAGAHAWRWDGLDDNGKSLAQGTYFAVLEAPGRREVQKIVVVR